MMDIFQFLGKVDRDVIVDYFMQNFIYYKVLVLNSRILIKAKTDWHI